MNNNNNKPRNNYFSNNINKIGEDFLDYKNSRDIEYDVPIIFRQLAQKRIDLARYGHFFFEVHFLESCINAINKKIIFYQCSYNGMIALIASIQQRRMQVNNEIMATMETHRNAWRVYSLINYYLVRLRKEGDINNLYRLCNDLSNDPILKKSII